MICRLIFKHVETGEILETLDELEYINYCIDYYVSLGYEFIRKEDTQ